MYEGAFLSSLTAGLASYSCGLFETSAFLLSQAEKIQHEYNVCSKITNCQLLKFRSVYCYSQSEKIARKLEQESFADLEQLREYVKSLDEQKLHLRNLFAAIDP